jgi:hypothetical protein
MHVVLVILTGVTLIILRWFLNNQNKWKINKERRKCGLPPLP